LDEVVGGRFLLAAGRRGGNSEFRLGEFLIFDSQHVGILQLMGVRSCKGDYRSQLKAERREMVYF